ncbi:MAG: 30S ribosomal protein S9 [Candidatus Acetothermia bacterium]|jgi:small subunit ribosomal protein S9|nr:30S ribosomal protein S9 [Candidatus Acetothermia bacterium]MDH7505440.1 30S ribosomal protein S9 [Candidatus Acetothermia bacterium]
MVEAKRTAVEVSPRLPKKVDGQIHAVGRRKESIARVYLKKGKGQVIVNGRPAEEYFAADPFIKERLARVALKPFEVTGTLGKFDVKARLTGGGVTGQLEALRLGVARALLGVDEGFRKVLRDHGLLTRDPRMVERKKYGRHKARRSEQYSKR